MVKQLGTWRGWWVAVLIAAATLAAACGSSAPAGPGASSPGTGAGLHGTPVKVLTFAPVNSQVISFPEALTMAKVAGDWINAHGGINGHPLQVITCDTQDIQAQTAACAREAVSDKVVAVVGGFDIYGNQYIPILQAAGIPIIGQLASGAIDVARTSTVSFPITPLFAVNTTAASALAVARGCKAIANIDFQGDPTATLSYAKLGAGSVPVKSIVFPATTTDFASVIAEVPANACIIEQTPSNSDTEALLRQYETSGGSEAVYSPSIGSWPPALATDAPKIYQGSITGSNFSPPTANSAWAPMLKAAALYNKQDGPPMSLGAEDAQDDWASYIIVWNALKGMQNPTAAALWQKLKTDTNVNSSGLLPALDFAKTQPNPNIARVFNPYYFYWAVTAPGQYKPYCGSYHSLLPALLGKPVSVSCS